MKRIWKILVPLIIISCIWSGCQGSKPNTPPQKDEKITISFDFEEGDDGFSTGFADIPQAYQDDGYLLQVGYCDRPPDHSKLSKSMILKGENNNEDMFLYTYRKIDKSMGIKNNTMYETKVSFDLGTSVSKTSGEAGTSHGQKIYVKIGVVNEEPVIRLDDEGVYTLNLDKGNHSLGGKDVVFIGNVEKDEGMTEDQTFEYKRFEYRTFVESNDKGECYVIIGYDSKQEGMNWHFIDNVVLEMKVKE